MKRGGNAVDAAIAVAFALAVTHPAAGNLGGGGFMMIRLKDGRSTAIDYREMAPAAAHRNVYLDKKGELIEGEGGSLVGYRAAGVPGTVRGMELALKKYGSGRLTWSQLVEPARQLAANGFYVATTPSSSFVYLLTGAHAAHLLGGILALLVAGMASLLHGSLKTRSIVVDVTAWYWHFMAALWIYIFCLMKFVR